MAGEKKRARGLKNSAKAKKAKTEDSQELPENAKTVVIDKEVEEGDELGETAALLESALDKLETDPAEALALIRGTIHESDRILRNLEVEATLPASFYYTYGAALYELGRLTDDEEFEPYLDLAEERLLQGQEDAGEMKLKIDLALTKVWLAKAANQVDEEKESVSDLAVKALEKAEQVVLELESKHIVDLADIVQNHGQLYSVLEHRTRFIDWAESQLKTITKNEPENTKALITLGLTKLQIVHYWLDNITESSEKKAYEATLECKLYLESAHALLEKENNVTPQLLFDLAEVYLNEANLVSEEEEQEAIYEKAVDIIRKSQALIDQNKLDQELPEGLLLFLEEYENA